MSINFRELSIAESSVQVLTTKDMHMAVDHGHGYGHGHGDNNEGGKVEVEVEVQEVEDVGGEVEVGNSMTFGDPLSFESSHQSEELELTVSGGSRSRVINIPIATFATTGTLSPYSTESTVLYQNGQPVYADNGTTTTFTLPVDNLPDLQDNMANTSQSQELIDTPSPKVTSTSNVTPRTKGASWEQWEEAVTAPVLPVRCKETNAELYKSKFGSGNKGKCLKYGDEWFTPTEFEAFSGRGNSKDWKRSIRFGGRTIHTLIDQGYLTLHASACICSTCVDDGGATGPIRPFTPYQRKRKSDKTEDGKTAKARMDSLGTDESSDTGTPMTVTPQTLLTSINPLTQALQKINNISLPSDTQEAWKVVENAVDTLVTASVTLKSIVQEMKKKTNEETERLRSQLQSQVQDSVQSSVVENSMGGMGGRTQILRIFDPSRMQTYSIEVMDADSYNRMETQSDSPALVSSFKCQNCGRDGSLECSACHVVHYCSQFCQQKDWPLHQSVCHDSLTVECKEESTVTVMDMNSMN